MQLPLLWQQSLWSNLGLSVWLKGTLVVGGFVCSVFFLLKATCLKVVLGAFLKEQQVIEQQNHNIRCFQLYPQGTKSINSRQKERKSDKLWWQLIKGFMMSPTLMWDLLFLNHDIHGKRFRICCLQNQIHISVSFWQHWIFYIIGLHSCHLVTVTNFIITHSPVARINPWLCTVIAIYPKAYVNFPDE